MIGIAMPSAAFNREMWCYNEKGSIFSRYKYLARKYRVDLCMFRLKEIRYNMNIDALVFSYLQNETAKKSIKLPRVNIVRNTAYVTDRKLIDRFELLRRNNFHLINFPVYSQANKYNNCSYLKSIVQYRSHVPPTEFLSYESLETYIEKYGKVIIKPVYGSRGREITIMEKERKNLLVYQTSNRKHLYSDREVGKALSIPWSKLNKFYQENFKGPFAFLVQQWIHFKQVDGRPFDIRAVVQKNGKNRWQVTSRVARVANKKGRITNLHQGGELASFSQLKLDNYEREICRFSLDIAGAFERLYPWSAEMGIDLAIGQKGDLWYIETNFCPEKKRWKSIFRIPFEYARHLHKTVI